MAEPEHMGPECYSGPGMPLGCVGLIILAFLSGVAFWALWTIHARKEKWAACEAVCSPFAPHVYHVRHSSDPDQCWYRVADTVVKCGHPVPLLAPGSRDGHGG